MKKIRKVKIHKFTKRKKSSNYFIMFPKILKLFFVVLLLSIYFINNKKGKEITINYDYNFNYTNNYTNNYNYNYTDNYNYINNYTNNYNYINNYNYTNNYNYINNFNQNKKIIHLSFNMDNNYIYACIVYLTSILHNRANSTFYIIHILTNNNLSKESKKKIDNIIERFGNNSVNLSYYNLEGYFKNATIRHLPVATYYKIVLPSLLPNVDKIIFTDVDIIDLEDLSEMYSIEFKENMYFCGIADYIDHLNQLREFGLSSDKYINSGVLLMNLKAMRENSIEKMIKDFIATHVLKFHDQTAINCVCYNNTQALPYKYNFFAFPSFKDLVELNNQQDIKYRANESELNETFNKPTLFHYVSLDKPWLKRTTKFNRVYWWYYVKMSGFYEEILDFYQFDKSDIDALLKQIPEDGGLLRRNYKKLD